MFMKSWNIYLYTCEYIFFCSKNSTLIFASLFISFLKVIIDIC